jgi:hypothetical protein
MCSIIWCGVRIASASLHIGQCGVPIVANSMRR